MSVRAPRTAWLPLGVGLFFATLFATQALIRTALFAGGAQTRNILIESFSRWLLYAALAPVVGAIARRVPLELGRLGRRIPLHVLAAIGFSLAHSVGMGLVYRAFHVYPRQDSLAEAIGRLFLTYFGIDFVIYWAISGAYHAFRYHVEVRRRDRVEAELRAGLTEARLDALRAQLHPHFLFNTLNATSALALTGEREQVAQVLDDLSELLRASLDGHPAREIPAAREWELLERYLEIQRVRFGARLSATSALAPDAARALVPALLLQPLVENAFEHGVAAVPGPGRVAVSGRRIDSSLCLRVEDSGPGFAGETEGATSGATSGIGLSNTRARLEQLFGAAHTLTRGNLPAGGAFVEVRIPFREAPEGGRP